MKNTGPDAAVQFDAQADCLGELAVGNDPKAASNDWRIDVTWFRNVAVTVSGKYLLTDDNIHATSRAAF